MIQASYQRNIYNNYLVIKRDENKAINYSMKMLLSNQIPGVLKMEIRTVDNKEDFYYDITSKQQVYNVFEKGQLHYEQIKRVMSFMIQTIEKASEYMLKENDFVLDPEYVYIQLSSFELSLCYLEGYNKNLLNQITEFIEYLMNKVDHQDEQAVLLIYSLYKVSREDECNLDKLKKVIEERKPVIEISPIFTNEQKESVIKPVKRQILTEIRSEEQKRNPISFTPIMKERVESEIEVQQFSFLTYALMGASILCCLIVMYIAIKSGLLFDKEIETINWTKAIALFIIVGSIEAYVLTKIFNSKNLQTKIKEKVDYINPIDLEHRKKPMNLKQPFPREEICNEETMLKEKMGDDNLIKLNESNLHNNSTWKVDTNEEFDTERTVVLAVFDTPADYVLKCLSHNEGEDITIHSFPFFVGKHKGNADMIIEHSAISRCHAKFELVEGAVFLTDLNSTNGTYINHTRLDSHVKTQVNEEDEIMFANMRYQFLRG